MGTSSTERHLDSQGETLSMCNRQFKEEVGLLFHAQEIFQKRRSQVYAKRQTG